MTHLFNSFGFVFIDGPSGHIMDCRAILPRASDLSVGAEFFLLNIVDIMDFCPTVGTPISKYHWH